MEKHRNDIYGDVDKIPDNVTPAIPAATVVLLRDADDGIETLMLHRTSKVNFGGMWVFPGGRIEESDYTDDGDVIRAARNAAARETLEECGVSVSPDSFAWFAHWTPPPTTPKRYATWFFATEVDADHDIILDGHEIQDHDWLSPAAALERHAAGEIDLAPPTWITLHHLSLYSPTLALMTKFKEIPHKIYETRIGINRDGVRVAMWHGDSGYNEINADTEGDRHRLIMLPGGFQFENTVEDY